MNTVHLVGAEQVQQAAYRMSSAADDMLRAASNIDSSLSQHQRFMDDWLQRLEHLLESLKEKA